MKQCSYYSSKSKLSLVFLLLFLIGFPKNDPLSTHGFELCKTSEIKPELLTQTLFLISLWGLCVLSNQLFSCQTSVLLRWIVGRAARFGKNTNYFHECTLGHFDTMQKCTGAQFCCKSIYKWISVYFSYNCVEYLQWCCENNLFSLFLSLWQWPYKGVDWT